jgi:hypothetical protein
MAALLLLAAIISLAAVGGFLGADSRDGAEWSRPADRPGPAGGAAQAGTGPASSTTSWRRM